MSETELAERKCQNLPAGALVLEPKSIEHLLLAVDGWHLSKDGNSIRRTLEFEDFTSAISFVNGVASLAEAEQHHPNIRIHSYRRVTLEFSTFSIGGLSENDFIMAAKLNRTLAAPE